MHSTFLPLMLGGIGALALTVACGGSGSNVTEPQPPPGAVDSAPTILQGKWNTVLTTTGEQVTLTITRGQYVVIRGQNSAVGTIGVTGDEIDFLSSSLCNATGKYRWSISGDSLQFGRFNDGCPGRAEVLVGQTYTRGS